MHRTRPGCPGSEAADRASFVSCVVLPPDAFRGQDLGPSGREVDHHRGRGGALDDEGVIARRLERGAPCPAGIGRPDDARERRLEDHVAPAGGRRVGADERRGGDDEGVVRPERIARRVDRVVEEPGRQAAAAEVAQGRVGVERHGASLAAGQVGDEHAAVESGYREVGHVQRLRYQNIRAPARRCPGARCLRISRGSSPFAAVIFTPVRSPDSAPKQLARRPLRRAQTRFGGFPKLPSSVFGPAKSPLMLTPTIPSAPSAS